MRDRDGKQSRADGEWLEKRALMPQSEAYNRHILGVELDAERKKLHASTEEHRRI